MNKRFGRVTRTTPGVSGGGHRAAKHDRGAHGANIPYISASSITYQFADVMF
jgi:hypothetical protein